MTFEDMLYSHDSSSNTCYASRWNQDHCSTMSWSAMTQTMPRSWQMKHGESSRM